MKIEITKNGEEVIVGVHGTDAREVLMTLLETYQNIFKVELQTHEDDCGCPSMEFFGKINDLIENTKDKTLKERSILKKMFGEE